MNNTVTRMDFLKSITPLRTMNAYIGFAEKAATALVGNKSGYLMAGVASYGAVG